MGKEIIWSEEAYDQLEGIHFYIAFETKSLSIADKVFDKIFESTSILKSRPDIFELDIKKFKNDGTFRSYFVYNYEISYQVTKDLIIILRVRHTSRLPKNL